MEELSEDTDAVASIGPVSRRTSAARTPTEIRSLARSHTRISFRALVGVLRSKDATPAARVAAANAILDRGWGKAVQDGGDDAVLQLIQRIERIIVHPKDSGGEVSSAGA